MQSDDGQKANQAMPTMIRVGVSSCLLGAKVRFDGGHKQNRYLKDILGDYFTFIPVCPEVAIGMGIPRQPIRLVGDPAAMGRRLYPVPCTVCARLWTL